MAWSIAVENIKCGGCASSIRRRLLEMDGVEAVEVDIERGVVTVEASESLREAVAAELAAMGYPERGSVEGMKAAAAKAKSFVSCAVGRMSGKDE